MPKKRKKVSSSSSYYELLIPIFLVILVTIGVFIFANQIDEKENMITKPISINSKKTTTSDILLSVAIKINGINQTANAFPGHHTRKVAVYLYGPTTSTTITKTAYLSYDGKQYFTDILNLGKLPEGSYFIKLTADHTLQILSKPEIETISNSQINILPTFTLYQGDMNDDTVLNRSDYNLALTCFQNNNLCTGTSVDFNDDGLVDILDYNLFLESFAALHAV